jgi:hypothetical protein
MKKCFYVLALSIVLGIPAFGDTLNLSTGVTGGATYTVAENGGATGTAALVTSSDADWYGGWVANSSTSAWIAYDPTNCCDNGVGDYSTTFTLTSGDLSSVALSGSWTLDDSGELLLNGNVIGTLGSGNWGSLTAFSVAAGSSDFVLGTNTLSIDITNSDNYLEGVNLEGSLTGYTAPTSPTPEPSSVLLLCVGFVGLFLLSRKRLPFPTA